MEVSSEITKTTNYKYKAIYNEIKSELPVGTKTIDWSVSLTSSEEKKGFLLLVDSALQQIKTDEFVTLIEKKHPGTNTWLRCKIPDPDHRRAMLLFLQKIYDDILSEFTNKKTKNGAFRKNR